ncbi:MAG: hypothetical protein CVV05_11230 [Gammaproteobacteria bacterium HGW-Gammaproteobacteria-1]|nr:MAG: hypothetical protein CVV05_11230 [Gammaproteobacteria bacterium HGW-Gammaproteobacteria-1]
MPFLAYLKYLISNRAYQCANCKTTYDDHILHKGVVAIFLGLLLFHRILFGDMIHTMTDAAVFVLAWLSLIMLGIYLHYRYKFRG